MTLENSSIRSQLSSGGTLRIGQGLCFIAGSILAVVSVWQSPVLGTVPTAELGLAAFTLAFVLNRSRIY